MELTFFAARPVCDAPVYIKAGGIPESTRSVKIGDKLYPAAKVLRRGEEYLLAVISCPAGETKPEPSDFESGRDKVSLADGDDAVDVFIGSNRFTSYCYSDKFIKPYLGPIATSFGGSFTRLDFDTKEHPHHRSVFLGIGEVSLCGADQVVDFWNESGNWGYQKHQRIENIFSNDACASFTAYNIWEGQDGIKYLDERRRFTFYNQGEACRYIDLDIEFTASYGDIEIGATKEAGPLGIRMAEALRGDRGGRLKNSWGAVSERECWGRPAVWCDYSGRLDGHECGVAVFDCERNERYPATWHIRDYGLFAPNNFFFKGGLTLCRGESLHYTYRLVFHEGDCDIAARHILFENENHISK